MVITDGSGYNLKILVTGGFGFLGGRIAQYFLNKGHDILLGTCRDVMLRDCCLDGVQVVRTPWDDAAKLEESCSGVDLIIHASGMNAKDCVDDPVGAINLNVLATANLLQSAIKQAVSRFLYISTIHVYTDSLQGVISEENCPTNLHPYASSHRAAEDVVLLGQKEDLIDGVVVRFSNGFGMPIRRDVNCWMLLVNDLCRQAVENKRLVLASNGLQVRNFIPISEMCSVIDFLVCKTPIEQRVGQVGPINVGGKMSFSVLEMAQLIQSQCEDVFGYTPDLLIGKQDGFVPKPRLDFKQDRLNALGYVHLHSLTDEIGKLLIYCYDNFRLDL